jgi:vacuolar protein 8
MAKAIAAHVQALHSDDADTHVAAAKALRRLAASQTVNDVTRIAAAGAIPPLVNLLRNGPASSKKHAAAALWNIAADGKNINQEVVAAAGAIAPLVELLLNGDDSTSDKQDAAGALATIMNNQKTDEADAIRVEVAAAGAIPLLVEVEQSGGDDAKKQAKRALKHLAVANPQNVVAIAQARGGVEALAVLANDDSDEIVRKTAVLALADLAADPVPTDFNCVACQDARRSVVTLPCKHCSLCHACAATIRSSTNACPICRGAIDSTVAFHLA